MPVSFSFVLHLEQRINSRKEQEQSAQNSFFRFQQRGKLASERMAAEQEELTSIALGPPPISRASKPQTTVAELYSLDQPGLIEEESVAASSETSGSASGQQQAKSAGGEKKRRSVWGMLKGTAYAVEVALQVRKVGYERKENQSDSLSILVSNGVEPCHGTDPRLLLGCRAGLIAKLTSTAGTPEFHAQTIQRMQQQLIRIKYLEGPDHKIAWFACRNTVASEPRTLYVAFRGTRRQSMEDWTNNVDATPAHFTDQMELHRGYDSIVAGWYSELCALLREQMSAEPPVDEVVLTGHSKGGSTALVWFLHLLREKPEGIDLNKLRIITFGSPMVTHSYYSAESMYEHLAELFLAAPEARVLHFVHECDCVPRSIGGQYSKELLASSKNPDTDRPQLRESIRYHPLLQPLASTFYISGGSSGLPLQVFLVPNELILSLLDLPQAFINGFAAAIEAHRMTHYSVKLQQYCLHHYLPKVDFTPPPVSRASKPATSSTVSEAEQPPTVESPASSNDLIDFGAQATEQDEQETAIPASEWTAEEGAEERELLESNLPSCSPSQEDQPTQWSEATAQTPPTVSRAHKPHASP